MTPQEAGKLGGRPKGSIALSTRKGLAARLAFAKQVEQNLQPIFNKLYEMAMSGDMQAMTELLNRAWGRPTQAIDNHTTVTFDIVSLAQAAARLQKDSNGVYHEIETT